MKNVPFKYTFPITKAEVRPDGHFIVGEASGPEVDAHGERMSPEAIERFAVQITERAARGDNIPYVDSHMKDGVLHELGELTRAWITEDFHLGVEVRLFTDVNAAADSLFKQVLRGKQYGMSIGGVVANYEDDLSSGGLVRTYLDVLLREISNTTRPAWTPSLGTVLSKAIDSATAEDAAGDNPSMDEELQSGQTEPATEKTDEEVTEAAEATVENSEAEAETETESAEKAGAEESDEDLEKAGKKISAGTAKELLGLYNQMTSTLQSLGLIEDAKKTDSQDDGETTESVTEKDNDGDATDDLTGQITELTRTVAELTAKVEEYGNAPAGNAPALVERAELTEDDVRKALDEMDPADRIRLGLKARFGE